MWNLNFSIILAALLPISLVSSRHRPGVEDRKHRTGPVGGCQEQQQLIEDPTTAWESVSPGNWSGYIWAQKPRIWDDIYTWWNHNYVDQDLIYDIEIGLLWFVHNYAVGHMDVYSGYTKGWMSEHKPTNMTWGPHLTPAFIWSKEFV